MLAVVALARRVRHVLGPDERSVAILADLDLNFLALVALNHELGALERICFEVVDVDSAVGVVFAHLGRILPSEEVLGAVSFCNCWVERAELKAVKFACDEVGRVFLVLAFCWESGNNSGGWLTKLATTVNFN